MPTRPSADRRRHAPRRRHKKLRARFAPRRRRAGAAGRAASARRRRWRGSRGRAAANDPPPRYIVMAYVVMAHLAMAATWHSVPGRATRTSFSGRSQLHRTPPQIWLRHSARRSQPAASPVPAASHRIACRHDRYVIKTHVLSWTVVIIDMLS